MHIVICVVYLLTVYDRIIATLLHFGRLFDVQRDVYFRFSHIQHPSVIVYAYFMHYSLLYAQSCPVLENLLSEIVMHLRFIRVVWLPTPTRCEKVYAEHYTFGAKRPVITNCALRIDQVIAHSERALNGSVSPLGL